MVDDSRAIQLALGHHQAGRLREAAAVYRTVLQSQPNHPDALHLFGVIAYQAGNLAGALGQPVWLLDRDVSPWYPGMRIFRQRAAGNWEEVMNRVAAALAELARLNRRP